MLTAVDSSVLLDVIVDSPAHAAGSEAALRQCAQEGGLVICECVLAEVRPAFTSSRKVQEFLGDWQLKFVPSSEASALLAGEIFTRHLSRRGRRGRVVADFLIAAHAQLHADRLLARNRGFLRDYFSNLRIILPD